jgi:outer membrane protein TolC
MNFRLTAFVLCLLLTSPLLIFAADPEDQVSEELAPIELEQPTFRIGMVTDGVTDHDQALVTLFQKEVQTIAEDEFIVEFPKSMQLSGKDSAKGVRQALDRLLADPAVDLIITPGVMGSNIAFKRTSLAKPVVAPFVVNNSIPEIPGKEEKSGVTNLAYIRSMFQLDRDIMALRKIISFRNLSLVIDRRSVEGLPELEKYARRLANEYTMDITLVPVGDESPAEALAAIPANAEAVLVGALLHMSEDEAKDFFQGLIKRGLPGFSIWSRQQVEQGLLAGDMPVDMLENLARRTAVTVQDILLGEEASSIDSVFSRGRELTINMATARALDIYPSLALMTGANLLNEKRTDIERHLTLQQAVNESLQANLDLSSAQLKVKAGTYAVAEARSSLLPQIGVATGATSIDDDRATLAGGTSPERAWTGSVSGSQQIYSESSWAAYAVEQHNQTGREMELDSVRLDIIQQTSVAYFGVLRAKTIEQLQKNNLKLTQANLKRARIRLSIGVAGPEEVYRWETKFASDQQLVLQKESATMDAMEHLNRLLDRPLQEQFIAEETDLSDPLLVVSDRLFFDLMNNPKYFRSFRNFSLQEAVRNRPELKVIDAAIAAKERLETANKRSYWLPEISIEGSVDQYFAEDGAGQRGDMDTGLDDTDWQIGVFARLPLFEGGRKSGALNRTRQELTRLKIQRKAYSERIGQGMLAALNRTRASYPSISLSREAADAANRNLQLTTDSYIQGIKSIIELLDAQNQALTTEQDAANAVYDFLSDLMGVQRAMGKFVIFLPEAERKEWRQRAEEYLAEKHEPVATN